MEISYNVLLSSLLSLHTFIQINGGSSSNISFLRLIDFLKFSRLTPLLEYGLLEEKDIWSERKGGLHNDDSKHPDIPWPSFFVIQNETER